MPYPNACGILHYAGLRSGDMRVRGCGVSLSPARPHPCASISHPSLFAPSLAALQGSTVRLTLRNEMGEVMEHDLVRGTPEYFDSLGGGPHQPPMGGSLGGSMGGGGGMPMGGGLGGSMGGGMPPGGVPSSLYASGNRLPGLNRYMLGTSWSAEMFAQVCVPKEPYERALLH